MSSEQLDLDSPHYGVTYPAPFNRLALALCESATRSLRILSPQLDPIIFDDTAFSDAISRLARRDSRSVVQILIEDSRPMVLRGHRLLTLARRLPSSIVIRKLADHPEMVGQTLITRDFDGALFVPGDDGPGFYQPDSRSSTQPMIDQFDLLWQRGIQDANFRQLGL